MYVFWYETIRKTLRYMDGVRVVKIGDGNDEGCDVREWGKIG